MKAKSVDLTDLAVSPGPAVDLTALAAGAKPMGAREFRHREFVADEVDLTGHAIPPHSHDRILASDLFDSSTRPRLPVRVALARQARRGEFGWVSHWSALIVGMHRAVCSYVDS